MSCLATTNPLTPQFCAERSTTTSTPGGGARDNVPVPTAPSYHQNRLHLQYFLACHVPLPPPRWGCSPKGAALLWAAPERQAALLPNVTSHGYGLVREGWGIGTFGSEMWRHGCRAYGTRQPSRHGRRTKGCTSGALRSVPVVATEPGTPTY